MRKTCMWLLAAAALAALSSPVAAAARNARSERTVAGVRATLTDWSGDVLADKTTAACSLYTAKAAAQLAKQNHASSCEKAIEVAYEALKSAPKQAAAIRSYGKKAHVTLHGNTATVSKATGSGHATLTYQRGLWYIAS